MLIATLSFTTNNNLLIHLFQEEMNEAVYHPVPF